MAWLERWLAQWCPMWCPLCEERIVIPDHEICLRCQGDLDLELLDLAG